MGESVSQKTSFPSKEPEVGEESSTTDTGEGCVPFVF